MLRDIDLEVGPGRLDAVFGVSGSGKTTLLQIIDGVLEADAGEVALPGPVTYLGEEDELLSDKNLGANVALALPRQTRSTQVGAARVAGLFDLVGLPTELADRLPRQLSAGQRQRAMLARALATPPSVLLLDEPFSALDPTTRLRLLSDVRSGLREMAIATVLVTHHDDEASRLADRWWGLVDGLLVGQHPTPGRLD